MSQRYQRFGLAAACVTLLAGCSGNGAGLDQGGRPLPPGGNGGGALTADFDSIQQHVFTPICSVCHAGASAPQGLKLDGGNSFALLVGVPSSEQPAVQRVSPGDPDRSYLVQKLEGHAAVGARMPFGGPPLPAATIAVIRQWITDGALRSAAVAPPAAFSVTAVAPAMHEILFAPPSRIVVEFSQELDRTRIDASSVRLELVAALGTALPPALPVMLTVPAGDLRALLIEPATPLADGLYRIFVRAQPATGLSSIGGARLGSSDASAGDTLVGEFRLAVQP